MEQIVKQRVVGAVVLVALAVIFIPALLEGPDEEQTSGELDIPPSMDDLREDSIEPIPQTLTVPPEHVTTVVIEEPTGTPAASDKSQEMPVVPAEPEPEPVLEPAPAMEPAAAPQPAPQAAAQPAMPAVSNGWVVQAGAFGQEANAMGLRDKLRKAGFAAFVEKVSLATGPVYRVRVGPEIERADAEALQQKLARETGVKGKVMSHP